MEMTPIKVHVKIEKELAIKAWRRAMRFKAFDRLLYFYATRLTIVWLVVATVDAINNEKDLAPFHLGSLAIVCIVACIYGYIKWYLEVESKTVGWEFDAILDDQGVRTLSEVESETRHDWTYYKSYKEYDEYLQIDDEDGNTTFLPKIESLAEAISITKTKIPSKTNTLNASA